MVAKMRYCGLAFLVGAVACGSSDGTFDLGGTGAGGDGRQGAGGAGGRAASGGGPSNAMGGSGNTAGVAGTAAGGVVGSSAGSGGSAPAAGVSGSGGGGASASGGRAGGGAASGGGDSGSDGGGTSGGGNSASGSGGASGGGTTGGMSGAGSGGTSGSLFPAGVTKPRIMIVGDSISAGPGCYKKYLLKNLSDNHYSKFEFVGEYNDDCGGGVRHSAVSCSTAEQYTQNSFMLPNCAQGQTFSGLAPLMTKHKPDLVMLQLGVNDVWGGKTTEQTLGNYEKLVGQARAANPKLVIAIARIQKIRPDCGIDDSIQKKAEALVNAVPNWARALSTAASPIFVADLWTNSDWSKAETLDCVHPNDVGAMRMGLNWYNTIKTILKPD